MALFLTGGGDQENFEDIDERFSQALGANAKVLVIPFSNEEKEYFHVKQRVQECFPETAVFLCATAENLVFEKIKDYDALFFEGGNTFKLITEVRSRMNDIKRFYQQEGKHIYADSAGAIILGNNVKSAFLGEEADEDENKLQDYRGVGLIEPWSIHCHFEARDREDLEDLMYDLGSTILALSEECSIFLEKGELENLGPDELEIFSFEGHKKLARGERALLDITS
ncbi:MAG: Type 1 glutamine amidotransferase-like domain-containing protein [Bacteriovoracaceae bacterium]